MPNPSPQPDTVAQITERVERLLVRFEELQRTNALLTQELESIKQERDSLKTRLVSARSRVDALLERVSQAQANPAQE
jgi:uncharacterized protein (TIGR02449 family)